MEQLFCPGEQLICEPKTRDKVQKLLLGVAHSAFQRFDVVPENMRQIYSVRGESKAVLMLR